MEYRRALQGECERVYQLVQETITAVYPRYYPEEVVEFFLCLHGRENIQRDLDARRLWVLFEEDELVGTGSLRKDHITRVFVHPRFQGKGYGSFILQPLEDEAAKEYQKVQLEASLPAEGLYEKRGYTTAEICRWEQKSGAVLFYKRMEKQVKTKVLVESLTPSPW